MRYSTPRRSGSEPAVALRAGDDELDISEGDGRSQQRVPLHQRRREAVQPRAALPGLQRPPQPHVTHRHLRVATAQELPQTTQSDGCARANIQTVAHISDVVRGADLRGDNLLRGRQLLVCHPHTPNPRKAVSTQAGHGRR